MVLARSPRARAGRGAGARVGARLRRAPNGYTESVSHFLRYPRQANPGDATLAPRRPLWLVIALGLVGPVLAVALAVYLVVT